jgi:hypothetical protein
LPVARPASNIQDQLPALELLPNRSRELIAPTEN